MRARSAPLAPSGASPSRVRARPSTSAWRACPRASTTRTMRAMHAIGCRSPSSGSSVSGLFCVATTRKPPSPASSSAASERARPTESGTFMPGKTTASRTGRIGSSAGTRMRSFPTTTIDRLSGSLTLTSSGAGAPRLRQTARSARRRTVEPSGVEHNAPVTPPASVDDLPGGQSRRPVTGVEPARPCGHKILSLARLPIPPPGPGAGARGRLSCAHGSVNGAG